MNERKIESIKIPNGNKVHTNTSLVKNFIELIVSRIANLLSREGK